MIRILIAEDMRLLRETLVASLELEDDLVVAAVLEEGRSIVATVATAGIDLAILDIDLPGKDGLTAAAEIRRDHPECRVLVLTSSASPGHVKRAIDIGVSGFVLKDSSRRELLHAVRTVAAGGSVLDPGLAFTTLRGPANPLTDREVDVLRCLASGADPKQIAAQLHLSYGTVRNYLAAAVAKLQARTRVDAVRIAQQAGWL